MNYKLKKTFYSGLKYLVLLFTSLVVLLPMLIILFGALKTKAEYHTTTVISPPSNWLNIQNFYIAFVDGKMYIGFINTAILLLVCVTLATLFAAMISYILQRFNFKLKKLLFVLFLLPILMPGIAMQVQIFQVVTKLGLYNTIYAPILLYLASGIVDIYIFMQFIKSIPKELDESAMIEGASYFSIFFKIILPLLKPAIVTIVILKSVYIYNDFYTQMLYMPDERLRTVSTALYSFIGQFSSAWQVVCAGIILVLIPTLIVFVTLQKYLYSGITGAVKS